MAGPTSARVDEVGVASMRLAHGAAQPRFVGTSPVSSDGGEDQMHLVGHQVVGPDLDAALADLFGERVPVDLQRMGRALNPSPNSWVVLPGARIVRQRPWRVSSCVAHHQQQEGLQPVRSKVSIGAEHLL
jgi:hypothetical protein